MSTDNSLNSPKTFWEFPWSFPHALLITGVLLLNGWLLQIVTGTLAVRVPPWPVSGWLLLIICFLCSILAYISLLNSSTGFLGFLKNLCAFLSSAPLSISVLIYVGILALLAGIIPQTNPHNWLQNINSSWPFALEILLLILNLGIATLKRVFIFSFTIKNTAFMLNHLGLWLVVLSMAFGSADLQKLRIPVQEGETTMQGFDASDESFTQPLSLPFGIKLHEFTIEEYENKSPKLYRSKIEIIIANQPNFQTTIEVNKPLELPDGWKIYQASFEEAPNNERQISIFEVVKDPWLPFVYLGGCLMALGSTLLFWTNTKRFYPTETKENL